MDGDDALTIAFDVTALRRLRDAEAAVEEAREWSGALGVVATDPPHVLTKAVRDLGLEPDFTSGPGGVDADTLADAARINDAERQVYVGTTDEHRAIADEAGWEYLDVVDAAEAADWRVQYAPPTDERDAGGGRDWL